MISIIHPSRGRPNKSNATIHNWINNSSSKDFEVIISRDTTDFSVYLYDYKSISYNSIRNDNRSCVDAINNAAKIAKGDIFVVVSDDTDCQDGWDEKIQRHTEGKSDFILKTDDGIQEYIVTMTVMDRKYYERDGYIYHPDFFHQFADTYMTCVADIRGRLIKSNLVFPHNHYSHLKEQPDALNKRNDDTWKEGQKTFVRLMKQFSPEERARITNKSMQGFMRFAGI